MLLGHDWARGAPELLAALYDEAGRPAELRLVVSGGRTFGALRPREAPSPRALTRAAAEREALLWALDLHADAAPRLHIAEGGAEGADDVAAGYRGRAMAAGRPVGGASHPAVWRRPDGTLDLRAGPARNARMLVSVRPHWLLACPGGSGTHDCVSRALALRMPVVGVFARGLERVRSADQIATPRARPRARR